MPSIKYLSILFLLFTIIVNCPAAIVETTAAATSFEALKNEPIKPKANKRKKCFKEKSPKLERVDHTATVGFVLGVLGLVFIPISIYLVPGLWFVAILFALAAIILSAITIRRTKRKILSIIGLIAGILGILFSISLLLLVIALLIMI